MPSFNSVQIIGNLTRDPEVKFTPKGTAVAELGIAVNRTWKDDAGTKREETTFIDVELWGRQAEVAGECLKKGNPVFIQGRLSMDQWEDKATSQKRTKLKVTGEQMQLLVGKAQEGKGEF